MNYQLIITPKKELVSKELYKNEIGNQLTLELLDSLQKLNANS